MDIKEEALRAHEKHRGKLEVNVKVPMKSKEDLSLYYTPGVAEPCKEIAKDPEKAYKYTWKGNTVAVVTDGSAVLGLGNIGGVAGMPVMEGKCALFKEFGGIDAVPICLDTQDTEEIISVVKAIAPSFGGINLEDISAPRCFEIEEALIEGLDIPVFHDDQYGTAIVCLAGMINALKIVGKEKENVKVVVSGAGAAGVAITKLFLRYGFKNLVLLDSRGILSRQRPDLNSAKKEIVTLTNPENIDGDIAEALKDADIFIGVSKPNIANAEMVRTMARDPIIFAMSNPDPEIPPEEAEKGGAKVIATGRSDYPNQINNVLVFPGIFRGALDSGARKITFEMKIAAALALANLVENPTAEKIIPDVFDERVCRVVAEAVKKFT